VGPFNSFDRYSRYVRGALVWLGYADPVESTQTVEKASPQEQELLAVMTAWAERWGEGRAYGKTASYVLNNALMDAIPEEARREGSTGDVVPIVPHKIPPGSTGRFKDAMANFYTRGQASPVKLGRWLTVRKRQINDNMRFDCEINRDGVMVWWVEKAVNITK
jgi:putative DNA primase/helicase